MPIPNVCAWQLYLNMMCVGLCCSALGVFLCVCVLEASAAQCVCVWECEIHVCMWLPAHRLNHHYLH